MDYDDDAEELPEFTDETPFGEVRAWLRMQVMAKGATCPCCQQFAKRYRRQIYGAMAAGLIVAHQANGRDWFHLRTATGYAGGDHSKLRYWGLIEEEPGMRPDGGRAGWWRVTPLGVSFVRGRVTVPKYALIYDNRLQRLDSSHGEVGIRDVLGTRFNYDELMSDLASS